MNKDIKVADIYKSNLVFWQTAWQQVTKPIHSPPKLNYLNHLKQYIGYNHKSLNILDLACGSGWLSFMLSAQGHKLVGVDCSNKAIEFGQKHLDSLDKECNTILFETCSILEYKTSTKFDYIILNASIEHFTYKQAEQLVIKYLNYLSQNGSILIYTDEVATGNKGEYIVLEDSSHVYQDSARKNMLLRNFSFTEINEICSKNNAKITCQTYFSQSKTKFIEIKA